MDFHTCALMALACPGHRGDTRGGQPPPPTVTSVQHVGAVVVSELAALEHITVKEGCGAEVTVLGSGGGNGGHIHETQHLWAPP